MNDRQILALRGPKTALDQAHAYASAWEEEPDASGQPVATAVVFLTNRECPYRCVMCDLWINTLDQRVEAGAIPAQIDEALGRLAPARQIKLYNAGSFFDPSAIPPADDAAIAAAVGRFERVIVECHPAFLSGVHGRRCLDFRDRLAGRDRGPTTRDQPLRPRLEVAMGLETAHEPTLARLNKQMTLDAFTRAAAFLGEHDIDLRVFVLLNPPFLRGDAAIEWACRSIDLAATVGATACSVIPLRSGNGAIEALGPDVERPSLAALEAVVEYGLRRRGLRVFADLWDVERLFDCACSPARAGRLRLMNRLQRVTAPVPCGCDDRL